MARLGAELLLEPLERHMKLAHDLSSAVLFNALLTPYAARGKGGPVAHRTRFAAMSDSQNTTIARLSERLSTLKERL
ncbi:MAG: hypothetical protein ABR584_02830 [Candidatus Baltobacteraceae bacterium]